MMKDSKRVEEAKDLIRKIKNKDKLSLLEKNAFLKAGYIKMTKKGMVSTPKAKRQIKLIEEMYGGI